MARSAQRLLIEWRGSFVEAADKRKVQTIAERVENANTMAVLWQLGVQFIQGYFINAPEEVVLRAER